MDANSELINSLLGIAETYQSINGIAEKFENEDEFYVSSSDELLTKFTDGYENSLGLIKLFNGGSYSETYPALNGAMSRVNILTDKFTWYLPSSYEIDALETGKITEFDKNLFEIKIYTHYFTERKNKRRQ